MLFIECSNISYEVIKDSIEPVEKVATGEFKIDGL
jgi:hypothetical protein